jgi:hypothetical protein
MSGICKLLTDVSPPSELTDFLQTPDPRPTCASERFSTIADMNRFHMSLVAAFIGLALSLPLAGQEQDRPGPDDWQRLDTVFRAISVQSGSRVADLGAGDGYFTTRPAKAAGGGGQVYAVDIGDAGFEIVQKDAALTKMPVSDLTQWLLAGQRTPKVSASQDPIQSLPDSYKLQFENDYVKVVRVRYAAGAKLPEHTHPPGATVYVYLNDSEGVIFRHVGTMNHLTRRPPVKTGSVRISTGMEEHHEAENTSGVDSEFLRVVLKTTLAGGRRGGRLAPSDPQFENGQMRISRLRLEPGQSMSIGGQEPALLIEVASGAQRWIDAARSETVGNPGDRPMELIRVDLLTKPTSQVGIQSRREASADPVVALRPE